MTATEFMLLFAGGASPWLVALLRKHHWDDDMLQIVSVAISSACFILGQFFDGTITWPLPSTFLIGLAAAFGLQQAGYQVTKRVTPKNLEAVEQL